MKTKANEAAGVPFTCRAASTGTATITYPSTNRVNRPVEVREVHRVLHERRSAHQGAAVGRLFERLHPLEDHHPAGRQGECRAFGHRGREGQGADGRHGLHQTVGRLPQQGRTDDRGYALELRLERADLPHAALYLPGIRAGGLPPVRRIRLPFRADPHALPSAGEVGRIDPEYAVPLLLEVFRYGNLDDPRVYSDYFTQYNLSAARAAKPSPVWPRS